LLNFTLWQLGVPPLHILAATSKEATTRAFELSADSRVVLGSLADIE
jgi:hypothetical protein